MQTRGEVFLIVGFISDQRLNDKMLFIGLSAAVLIQFLFPDQKIGDAFCEIGITAGFIRYAGDSDDGQQMFIMIKRKIDSLLCAGKIVVFCYFQYRTGNSGLLSNLVKGSDTG